MTKLLSSPALVLTNNDELKESVLETLYKLQYKVDYVSTVSEALQKASETKYLFIIASEEPSKAIDTLELYNKLKASNPESCKKLIFFTEDHSDNYLNAIHEKGIHLLHEPYKPTELTTEIEMMRHQGLLDDNRSENRYKWNGNCVVDGKDNFKGKAMDVSTTGIKMYYIGEPIPEGAGIEVQIPDLEYSGKAQIKWSFKMGEKSMIGLDLQSPITMEELRKIVPIVPTIEVT